MIVPWLIIGSVLADEVDLLEDVSLLEDTVEESRFAWSTDHEWKPLRLYRPLKAVTSTWNGRLLVMDDMGIIHRMRADGSWEVVYDEEAEVINEEDLLLDLESSISEQWDEQDEPSYDDDSEEEVEPEALSNEWEAAIDDPLLIQGFLEDVYTIWTDEKSPLVFACSKDGCLRSTDNGDHWVEMSNLPPAVDFSILNGVYVAATPVGMWVSIDSGRSWKRQLDIPQDLLVHSLTMHKDFLVAGTSSGIWSTIDGLRWSEMRAEGFDDVEFTELMLTIDNQLWAMSALGFLVSEDLANQFSVQPTQLFFNQLVEDEWNGGVLAFSDNMVWETQDMGLSWAPLAEGLPPTQIEDAEAWKGSFVIATEQGGYYLSQSVEKEVPDVVADTAVQDVDVEVLIEAGTTELDQQMSELSVEKATRLLRWVPTVSVTYDYGHDRSITVNYDSQSSLATEQIPWKVVTNMCFGNCQTASTDVGFSNLTDDVMVVGNNVYRSDLGGVVPAASNVSLALHEMRRSRTQRIIDLYSVAVRLDQQKRLLLKAPLAEQVRHQIEQEEVAAYLDLYTDGIYYSVLKTKE